jgi:hypothetical protein
MDNSGILSAGKFTATRLMKPALDKSPTCMQPAFASAHRWHRREGDDFETIMETGVMECPRCHGAATESRFLGFAWGRCRTCRGDGKVSFSKYEDRRTGQIREVIREYWEFDEKNPWKSPCKLSFV